jgi:hypothetical protein
MKRILLFVIILGITVLGTISFLPNYLSEGINHEVVHIIAPRCGSLATIADEQSPIFRS